MKKATHEIAVNCAQLTKTYTSGTTQVVALNGVNLEVRTGELLMLAGPSGCGKTTLISIIAGILNYSQGACTVLGEQPANMKGLERLNFRAKNIGFVFQAFNLIPNLTVAENAAIPLIINGMQRAEATKKAKELLAEIGLAEKVDSAPASLSGGQQQRVAIARALVHNPKLIVCDEPTSALDGETGQKILTLMKKIAMDQNRTLIVVTHDIRIFPFADRIAMMEDGHVRKILNSYQEALEEESAMGKQVAEAHKASLKNGGSITNE
jgi:putative ABC transport system ATP-binding protein